jgi:hypothetical protein
MNQRISGIDNPYALTAKTPNAADCRAPLTEDAQPRTYKAFTERPADFVDFFTPSRRGSLKATPTYCALTERPADFERPFVPPRRQRSDAGPTYRALTERPGETPEDESAALEVPPGTDHVAA